MGVKRKTRRGPGRQLGREEWTAAATSALRVGGWKAVAVEPLAKALSVTKGSFYHHFSTRNDLIQALMEAFEASTEQLISRLETVPDHRARLIALIQAATRPDTLGLEAAFAAEAAARTGPVSDCYRRVGQRRRAYLAGLYTQLGLTPEEAEQWSTLTYTWFLGLLQRLNLDAPASDDEVAGEVDFFIERLLPIPATPSADPRA